MGRSRPLAPFPHATYACHLASYANSASFPGLFELSAKNRGLVHLGKWRAHIWTVAHLALDAHATCSQYRFDPLRGPWPAGGTAIVCKPSVWKTAPWPVEPNSFGLLDAEVTANHALLALACCLTCPSNADQASENSLFGQACWQPKIQLILCCVFLSCNLSQCVDAHHACFSVNIVRLKRAATADVACRSGGAHARPRIEGASWGRAVAEEPSCWHLDTGHMAKKCAENLRLAFCGLSFMWDSRCRMCFLGTLPCR